LSFVREQFQAAEENRFVSDFIRHVFSEPPSMLEVASRSVPGSAHPYEDRVLVDERLGLFAVADGVTLSSQGSGAVAAELVLRLLHENFLGDLAAAIGKVHQIVARRREGDGSIGETTLTAVAVSERSLQAANVGDSPAYLVRRSRMQSLVQEDKSPEGWITQVIGFPETVDVHNTRLQLEEGDTVIVASDGVGHVLRPPLVTQPIGHSRAADLAEAVINEARKHVAGYDDDKSVIVLRFFS